MVLKVMIVIIEALCIYLVKTELNDIFSLLIIRYSGISLIIIDTYFLKDDSEKKNFWWFEGNFYFMYRFFLDAIESSLWLSLNNNNNNNNN